MDSSSKAEFFLVLLCIAYFILIAVIFPPELQNCHSFQFPNNAYFSACDDLPLLDSSIHWNYHFSSNSVDMAFKNDNVKHNQWIAWAINPNTTGMVGSQAFVAFKKSDGTMSAYTSPITSYGTKLEKGNLSFEVHAFSASFEDSTMIIYAKFQLPGNSTRVNQIWQQGFVSQDTLQRHAIEGDNLKSFGQLDFLDASYYPEDRKMSLLRNVSGILNGIGWGILMPIGIMIARYLKLFKATKSAWFHLHLVCQIVAYVIGTTGFVVAIFHKGIIKFLFDDPIGILLYGACTIQILFFTFVWPNEDQSRKRLRWKFYHFIGGFFAVQLAMISGGFSIPKRTYIGILLSLGCVATILEFQLYRFRLKEQNLLKNLAQVHPQR